jgi:hypothetical protein
LLDLERDVLLQEAFYHLLQYAFLQFLSQHRAKNSEFVNAISYEQPSICSRPSKNFAPVSVQQLINMLESAAKLELIFNSRSRLVFKEFLEDLMEDHNSSFHFQGQELDHITSSHENKPMRARVMIELVCLTGIPACAH